jgi:HK97 gp10 family phage protein
MRVTFKGLNEFRALIRQSPNKVGKAIGVSIKKSALLLEAKTKQELTRGPNRAIDTGTLRSQVSVRELTPTRATLYPLVNYAVYVHEGTRRMRPRPFFKDAIKRSQREIDKIFLEQIDKIFK